MRFLIRNCKPKKQCRRFVIFLGHSILFSFLCHLRFPFKFTASGSAIQSNVCFAVAILFNSIFKETYHKKTNFSYCVLVLVSRLMKTNVMCVWPFQLLQIQMKCVCDSANFQQEHMIFFSKFCGLKIVCQRNYGDVVRADKYCKTQHEGFSFSHFICKSDRTKIEGFS